MKADSADSRSEVVTTKGRENADNKTGEHPRAKAKQRKGKTEITRRIRNQKH